MGALDGQAVPADGLHLLGPGVDQGDVVTGSRQVAAQVAPDRARADEQQPLRHRASLSISSSEEILADSAGAPTQEFPDSRGMREPDATSPDYALRTRTGEPARNARTSSSACG